MGFNKNEYVELIDNAELSEKLTVEESAQLYNLLAEYIAYKQVTAFSAGEDEGSREGYLNGFEEGRQEGYEEGYDDGYNNGFIESDGEGNY